MACDILMLSPTLKYGGAERLRATVAKELVRQGYSVRVVALRAGGPFAESLRNARVPVDVLGIRGTTFDVKGQLKLRAYLGQHNPTIVQSGQFLTNYHSVLAARSVGGSTTIIEEHGFNDWKRLRHQAIDRFVTGRRADGIIACSQAVANAAVKEYRLPANRVRCIHNCVDLDALEKTEEESLEVPAAKGPVVGTVGTLRKEKGHDVLVAAWLSLLDSGELSDKAELWFVGDGPMRPQLEAIAADYPSIRVLGSRNDVGVLVRKFTVFAFPSHSEGFGIALAEAMYLGLAAVASDVGGIPELISDQETGLLVPVGDTAAVASAIAELLGSNSRREALGRAAKTSAKRRFSPATYAKQLIDFAIELGASIDPVGGDHHD